MSARMLPAAPMLMHERIRADVEAKILSGSWPPGHHIPSELDLADRYGCSRMTVNKVLTQLARDGMIERRRKAGSFVMRPPSRSAVLEISDIRDEVRALGQTYRYDIVGRKSRRSTRADIALLQLEKHAPVLDVVTLHFAGDTPFCLEERLINLDVVAQAAEDTFVNEPPGTWLIHHVPWNSAEHRIRAAAAGAHRAQLLALPPGAPCLEVERRTWAQGTPVTWVCLRYPAEGHELVARFSPSPGGPPK